VKIVIKSDGNVDRKVRDHDQYREGHAWKWEKEEQNDREGIKKRQRCPIDIYGERNIIIAQQSIPMNVYYMIDCPIGKSKDINGENYLYEAQFFAFENEK
jgi:hypothetical protein